MLAIAEAHILMEEEKMECQTNAKLHRKRIKFNPETFEVLVLIIHKLVHPGDLLHEVLIIACHRLFIEFSKFCIK